MIVTLCQSKRKTKKLSTIDIHAYHKLSHEDALTAADKLSCDLSEKFGIDYGWEDEGIPFERPGVHGQILVNDTELRIQANLGFMYYERRGLTQDFIRAHMWWNIA